MSHTEGSDEKRHQTTLILLLQLQVALTFHLLFVFLTPIVNVCAKANIVPSFCIHVLPDEFMTSVESQ